MLKSRTLILPVKTPWRKAIGVSMLMGLSLAALPGAWAQDEGTTDGPNVVEQEGEPQAPANASQLDSESIEKSGGVGRANAGFTDGGAQTPVDQRPNALSFDQLDVNGDGVIDQDEAISAKQETMFQQLGDEQAGGVTRERFESAMGADTLKP